MVRSFVVTSLFAFVLAVPIARGQIVTGSIAGRVADPTGAVVSEAAISLVQLSTGVVRSTTTDAVGNFLFGGLDGGEYLLKVVKSGFKTFEQRGIMLTTGDRLSLTQTVLELGTATETVAVTASVASVQTASSDRSDVITGKQIEGILVQGRNITDLLQLVPGIYMDNTQSALSGSISFYAQGSRSTANNVSIDGVMATDLGSGGSTKAVVSMGAVGEVKIMVGNYQAEHGRMSGSNIEIVTKSGARAFHGEGEYFMRREWLNANTFFNNRNGVVRPKSRFNTITYNIGGPVYIPRLFNRERQKLFFFWNQEYWPTRQDVNGRVTVPSANERSGDFAQSLGLNNAVIPVRDPFNGNVQFPGNVIPRSRLDSNGQALLNMFPLPNFSNRSISLGAYNYVFSAPVENTQLADTLKLDYNLNANNFLSGSFSYFTNPQVGAISAGNNSNWPQLFWSLTNHPTTMSIRYTRIFTPALLNEIRVGGLTQPVDTSAEADALKTNQRDTVGFRTGQLYPSANPLNVIPNATFGGVTGAANLSIEPRFPRYNRYQVASISDNMTWTRSNHIFKAGIYYEYFHRIQKGSTGNPPFNGSFDFGINANNPVNTNYAYGNAVLGTFNTYTEVSSPQWMHVSMNNTEAFLQDTWRPFRRLTLDYGVRLYWISPILERDNLMGAFVPSAYDAARPMQLVRPAIVGGRRVGMNPVTGQTYSDAAIGAIAPGVGIPYNGMILATANKDYPPGMVNGSGTLWGPRAGFAYDVFGDASTALRGGFGMFHTGYQTELFGNFFVRQPPLTQTPVIYYGQLSQLLSSQGFIFPSTNTYAADATGTLPVTMSFSLSVQRKLWGDTILDVGYASSLARHLQWMRNINAIPIGANFAAASQDPTTPGRPLPANFLRGTPGYGPINIVEMAGSSNYHSLQVSARRRFAQHLQFGAAWTWSKTMDFNDTDTSAVTTLVPLRSWHYGLAGYDRTHVVKLNYLWDVPRLPVRGTILRGIFHGWELSGITSFVSGQPLGVGFSTTTAVDIAGTADLGARIVVTGPPVLPKDQRTFTRVFDTSVFRLPAVGTVGNAGKTLLRGPGVNNWDAAIAKSFPIRESLRLQFRCEAYNVFNHTQFSAVSTAAQFNPATGQQTNGAFGSYTAARVPRTIQLVVRVIF
ncbi:MAG: TonB-dependent receptor [Acidobacteria bacterium]|nr:TonB-dependent receptor [Acidobacteriota bacterium]